jgi:membrane dipeptidase
LGEQVIQEMNRLGIMIDISHVHDDTFWDVIKLTRAPIIASHSSARAVHEHPRNMSNKMLKAIQKNGGVVQICILDDYIKELEQTPEREAAIQELEKEWEILKTGQAKPEDIQKIIAKKQAIDQHFPKNKPTVADVVDHIDHLVKVMGIDHVGIGSDFDGGGGVQGLTDVSEFPNLTQELMLRGYTKKEISKIWGGNLMRVFDEVQKIALESQTTSQ